jgi:uracil-DNA glycosylase family 4
VSREIQILEAMGLGPVWQARPGQFADHPAAHRPSSEAPASQLTTTQPATPPQAVVEPAEQAPALLLTTVAIATQPELVRQQDTAEQETTEPVTLSAPLSWSALEKTVASCELCPLCKTRTQTVFGRGSETARWLLIGEAPGEQEDRQGEPFVGRAGHLLNNILAAAQLSSERDVYIANVLKCRPPGNRNPTSAEIAACQDYLRLQIQHVQPEIIVALGRFAAQTLLASELSISRLRGAVHDYQGIPLIVSYHPAYLLRNPPDKARAWEDWQLAVRTVNGTRAAGG